MASHESNRPSSTGELSRRGLLMGLVGSALALSACGENKTEVATPVTTEESAPNTTPSASASETVTPEPTTGETVKTREQLVAELEIKAGLSPEEFGAAYMKLADLQSLAGGTEEFYTEVWSNTSNGTEEIKAANTAVAIEQSGIFGDALYTPDWRQNPQLVYIQSKRSERTAMCLYQDGRNFYASGDRFKVWSVVDSVKLLGVETHDEGDIRQILIKGVEYNNGSELPRDVIKAVEANNSPFEIYVTTKEIDGVEKVTHVDTEDRVILN